MHIYTEVPPPKKDSTTKNLKPKDTKWPLHLLEPGMCLKVEEEELPAIGGIRSLRSAVSAYKRRKAPNARFQVAPWPEQGSKAYGIWRLK